VLGEVLALGLVSAVFPTLLAGVLVILSRPHPARLLVGFWFGGFSVSVIAGLLILHVLESSNDVLGTSSDSLSPAAYFIAGALASAVALMIVTSRGQRMAADLKARHPRKPKAEDKDPWATRVLARGSFPIAFAVGAVINLPGPFYLIALGSMADANHSAPIDLGLVLIFNLCMFLLVEIPILGWMFRPERTTELVARLAAWLNRNGLRIVAAVIGVFGIGLLVKGFEAL
jgi:hypothetical protein